MCGIICFNFEDKGLLQKAMATLSHRGPDDYGMYMDRGISLGHRRLSIIDVSSKGKQPMPDNTGEVWITYNGEVYNYRDIRRGLGKYHFRSETDTEVIISAYKKHGERCLEHFNGMFAFCIYDRKKRLLFAARDRLGVKPLYYYFDGTRFICASEIKAILQCKEVKRAVNSRVIAEYFAYGFPMGDETAFQGIRELPAGHYLLFDLKSKKLSIKKYWSITEQSGKGTAEHYAALLRKHLERAVRMRLVSDVPLGATLSGGLDSSSIVAVMSKVAERVKTITVGYEEGYDEFRYARLVAERCGTEHREVMINFPDVTQALPRIAWHMDTPVNKSGTLATFFLAQALKKQVTVALIGEGSDEIFGGYPRHRLFAPERPTLREFGNIRRRGLYYSHFTALRMLPLPQRLRSTNLSLFSEHERAAACRTGAPPLDTMLKGYMHGATAQNALNRFLIFELQKTLPQLQLARIDKMSMAHAVEARVPFLDYRLAEFSMTIPSRFKMRRYEVKDILKKSVQDLLPREILQREKMGLRTPLEHWFRHEFMEIAPHLLADIDKRKYINARYVRRLLSNVKPAVDFKGYRFKRNISQLWFLCMLEIWHKLFMEQEKPRLEMRHYL
ncbi:MAG TPA: asparagine synthase (glutamine-hydrolyzing) [Candidatus Nanoarchaeia archaeon]|nr:asparagine synthase (glutamine-hydrolyzing) [Candidatus Nanoarchaeia archaeon]